MKVAIYSRKSKFTGKGESVENQIQMCREYIAVRKTKFQGIGENNIIVFEDEGYSGKNLNRPEFQEMMTLVREKQLDCIICYRLDRISRSVSDFSSLVEEFNNLDVSLICIKEEFDTKTPMGSFMMTMLSALAQLERQTIAERVRDNMMMLARTGRWLGGTTPTGFTSEKENTVLLEDGKMKTSCKLKWNPDEIDTVKMIYSKFIALHSLSGVNKFLMKEHKYSRSGKVFSAIGLKDILSNPVYCVADKEALNYFLGKGSNVCFNENECSDQYGLLSYNKRDYSHKSSPRLDESEWIIAIGKHHGIVSGQDWVAIQKILAENKTSKLNHTNTRNNYSLLSGLLICTRCHSRMFAKRRSNSDKIYDYICSNKQRGNSDFCNCPNLNGSEADDLVSAELMSMMDEGPDGWKRFEKRKKEIQIVGDTNPLQSIDKQTAEIRVKITNYVKILGRPDVSDDLISEVNQQISRLKEAIKGLEQKKQIVVSQKESRKVNLQQLNNVIECLSYFKIHFNELSIQERRDIIRILVDRIEWDGENLHIFTYGE